MRPASSPRPGAAARLDEAVEGIDHLRDEIDEWVALTATQGPPGAHLSRVDSVQMLLSETLDVLQENHHRSSVESDPYVAALRLDRQVLACRRILRWFALRFAQRTEPMLRECLLGADEVVWSVWRRTVMIAGESRRPPAPLCFVDNDPVPWASVHRVLPGEVRPPSRDPVLGERIRALPVPVIGLPPVVARRPWWLVTAVHETGHHVSQTYGTGPSLQTRLQDAVRGAGADAAEAAQWGAWSEEIFADGFAAMFVGSASLWALTELEHAASDWIAIRPTYPPAAVRLALAAAMVAATGAPVAPPGDGVGLEALQGLLRRIPAVVDAVLDQPIGAGSLRRLGDSGEERAFRHKRWARLLATGSATPVAELGAAEACIAGAVIAWAEGRQPDALLLRRNVLAVLPACCAPGQRAIEQIDVSAGLELARTLLHDGSG